MARADGIADNKQCLMKVKMKQRIPAKVGSRDFHAGQDIGQGRIKA